MTATASLSISAEADTVEITMCGTPNTPARVLAFRPEQAQEFARQLNLFAEKAECIARYGEDAAVGDRSADVF